MEFGDFRLSPHKISFIMTKIEILPVESPVLKGLFGAIFPSAIVKSYEYSDDYPPSKISVEKLKVGLRMRLLTCSQQKDDQMMRYLFRWARQLRYFIFQRPMIRIELTGVTLEVEKAYIAPSPPPMEFDSLPSAISHEDELDPKIPTFDQDVVMEFLKEDELRDADGVTFWLERWSEYLPSHCLFLFIHC